MNPYNTGLSAGFRPDPLLTVSEWADANRWLSQTASAEHGKWRTSRTPYLREVMDSLGPTSPNQETSLMKAAQLGGSEAGNNWLAFIMAHTPGPTLAVMPNVEMAKRNSKTRIDPMIQDCPALRAKVVERQAGDRRNHETVLQKEFPGGVLVMTGANSAAGLRSMPCRFMMLDEIDGYPQDVDGEGDPINLAIARARTYPRRKIFRVSTPTVDGGSGNSRIAAAFEEGSAEYFHVPCPHCGELQRLVWANVKWPKGHPEQAQYQCSGCQQLIPEHKKTWMLERGEWAATHPERRENHRSFHLSSLYSPVGWMSWADAANMWEAAQKDTNRLKVFVNTVLGEVWQARGDAPEWRKLYDRRGGYPEGRVPMRGLLLVAGTDVQADRLETSIYAFGRNRESWLISHVVIDGKPSDPEVWQRLAILLNTTFPHESGASLSILKMAVDSGFMTQEVYRFGRQQGPGRVLVVKGIPHGSAPVGQPTAQDVSGIGKRVLRGGIKLWPVVTPILKSELYGWLGQDPPLKDSGEPFPAGYCHFGQHVDEEFLKQLTAEQLVLRTVKGFTKMEWEKTRRNEALDCRIYARAASIVVGIDHYSEYAWATMENQLRVARPDGTPPQAPPVRREVRGRFL